MGLLDEICTAVGAGYISNLQQPVYEHEVLAWLQTVSAEHFSAAEWNDADSYFSGAPLRQTDAQQARAHLLQTLAKRLTDL